MWLVKLLAAVLKVEKGVVWLVVVKLSVVTEGLGVDERLGLGVILGDVRLVEIKPSISDIMSIRPERMFGLGEKKVSIDPCLDGFLAMLSDKSDGIRLRFGSLGEAGALASVSRIFLCSF